MSVDLNFWRYQKGASLKDEDAYQKACCDHEWVEGLELLPIEDILNETAKVFCQWTSLDPFHYEGKERGSFQISTTPQTVRFDCYSMEKAEMKRFSSVLSQFGCPLYDPQQGARFDKLAVFSRRDRARIIAAGAGNPRRDMGRIGSPCGAMRSYPISRGDSPRKDADKSDLFSAVWPRLGQPLLPMQNRPAGRRGGTTDFGGAAANVHPTGRGRFF